ncbi:MFS transporter [Brevibacterium album]|uniref:MFS transporter n=1 Tax=Brevibacterium album TaxID=417948 RepID=UPI0012EC889E|nr:MFS transporter [Brevibacterium album]
MQQSQAGRRARAATMVAFATNGTLPATLLARYAEVKDALDADAGVFGLLVAGFMIGAAGAFQTPGAFLRRWGSRWVTSLGTAWMAAAFLLAAAGVALGNPWIFTAGLVLAGYGDAVVDVAQNSQGLRVQEAHRRSLLSSMHAGWSIGAAAGGIVGTIMASAEVPLLIHLAVWGVLCTVTMACAARSFLPDRAASAGEGPASEPLGRRAAWLLIPLALVALAGVSVEDVGNNWSAVFLAAERDVSPSMAGIGLSVILGAQFIGRMIGDRFIDRVGNRPAVITSLILIAGGLITAAWTSWVPLTLTGFALAGLGCAITVPLAFAGADALPGLKAHAGVTWVNWIMRAATIALTPAIGGITTIASLPIAITAAACITLVALAAQIRSPGKPRER